MTANGELQRLAREDLKGNWGLAAGATVIYILVSGAAGALEAPGIVISALLAGPMLLGFNMFFLAMARRQAPPLTMIFSGFNNFLKALIVYLLVLVFVLLWSLLLIVPGVVAALSYSMTWFILADEPGIEAYAAMQKSRRIMMGKRWKLFGLLLRFLGWGILAVLTLGIGFLWLLPYMQTALARFWLDLKMGSE